ncbi:MAG: hypothetical protein JW850_22810 [Thermoflexales bacterium]|nr:hypothetical protein [Thermoflexales bacterium]
MTTIEAIGQIEPRSSSDLAHPSQANWKTIWLMAGGAIGLLLGVAAVYLYIQSVEAEQGEGSAKARQIKPAEAMKVALAVVTAIREFTHLGME